MTELEVKRIIIKTTDYGFNFMVMFFLGVLLVNAFGWSAAFLFFILGIVIGTAINTLIRWWLKV